MTTSFLTYLRVALALVALSLASPVFAEGAAATAPADTFALVRQGGTTVQIWGPHNEFAKAVTPAAALANDTLYVHRAGTHYTVTDPALVARARAAWDRVIAAEAAYKASDETLNAVVKGEKVPNELMKKHQELVSENAEAAKDLEATLQQIATTAFAENHIDPM